MNAKEYKSQLIQELIDSTTQEELDRINKEMEINIIHEPKYTIEKFHYKGYSIWKTVGNVTSPVLILRKPKFISEEEYENFIKSLKIFYGGGEQ